MTEFTKGCCCPFELDFLEDEEMELDFGEVVEVQHGYDPYEGPYVVTPKFQEQTLATKDKNMEEDVIVEEIAVVKVGNTGGGYTVTIGG